ncbi:hypothetical protein L7F22_045309 [Adiantum nelumboides]|nr:hypothetical protein [Adiantum nelumboides]
MLRREETGRGGDERGGDYVLFGQGTLGSDSMRGKLAAKEQKGTLRLNNREERRLCPLSLSLLSEEVIVGCSSSRKRGSRAWTSSCVQLEEEGLSYDGERAPPSPVESCWR